MKQKTQYRPKMSVTSRGLAYFDDCAGRVVKYHNTGTRNIYSVVLTYGSAKEHSSNVKTIRMDYGRFKQAIGRFLIETRMEIVPSRLQLDKIEFLVCTYKGTKKVFEDVLTAIDYKARQNIVSDMENHMMSRMYIEM